jgi:hypothetical protein
MTSDLKLAFYALHEENMMILRTLYQLGRLPKQEADSVISELDECFIRVIEDEEFPRKK